MEEYVCLNGNYNTYKQRVFLYHPQILTFPPLTLSTVSEEMDIITVFTNTFLLITITVFTNINYSLLSSDCLLSEFMICIKNYVHYES